MNNCVCVEGAPCCYCTWFILSSYFLLITLSRQKLRSLILFGVETSAIELKLLAL